jgi:hypothetical protein
MRYSFAEEPSPDSRRSRIPNDMVLTLAPFPSQFNKWHHVRFLAIQQNPDTRLGGLCIGTGNSIRNKASLGRSRAFERVLDY